MEVNYMRASRVITIILGFFMIIAGFYCLFNPAITYLTLGYVIGVTMIFDAIGGLIFWNERKKKGLSDGWALVGAIASLVFGIVLIGSAALQLLMDMAIIYLVAIWLVVIGVIRIFLANKLRKTKDAQVAELLGRHWLLLMIAGILLVICGILSFMDPTGLIVALGIHFGLNVIIVGANMIAAAA